jgi:hypothetical protein
LVVVVDTPGDGWLAAAATVVRDNAIVNAPSVLDDDMMAMAAGGDRWNCVGE